MISFLFNIIIVYKIKGVCCNILMYVRGGGISEHPQIKKGGD